jgi:hypothetical protein
MSGLAFLFAVKSLFDNRSLYQLTVQSLGTDVTYLMACILPNVGTSSFQLAPRY